MSYSPPPGLKASSSSTAASAPASHSSLPPRPTATAAPLPSFKPAFSGTPSDAPGTAAQSAGAAPPATSGYGGFSSFTPRQVGGGSTQWSGSTHVLSAPPAPPQGFSAPTTYTSGNFQPSQYPQAPSQQHYQQPAADYSGAATPQIRNPFPLPGQEQYGGRGGGRPQDSGLDPEMEAQIAQWQSAYAGKDAAEASTGRGGGRAGGRTFGSTSAEGPGAASGANAGPLGGRVEPSGPSLTNAAVASAVDKDTGVAAVVTGSDGKQKTVVRSGGGQTWSDSSLLEWDPAHFRLFVGNLAGEVTDESLLKAFARYPSVQKARVVRDKRTTKSKGYGFVSFSNGDEYFQAAREMQGKYIGSHPVLLRRSTTEIKAVVPGDKKGGKGGKGGKGRNQGGRGGGGGGGDKTGAGVQKKSSKTKGGLRVLG